ncbi:MAG: hypothetical protein H3C48_20695, partial [Chitinophagaceae bacterium]|nr:hypothetical protein [Chitinophagaceae bacterium]
QQQAAGTPGQTTVTVTQTTYDTQGRVIKTEKKLSNTQVNGNTMSDLTTVTTMEYDELGQLRKKKPGSKKDPATGTYYSPRQPLEEMAYDYNIRGWLLGINKDYITGTSNSDRYFGFELGYDQDPSIGSYAHKEYNGNISGVLWKSEGDQQKRKYDFSYDAANRLLKADFNQQAGGAGFDKSAGIDFSLGGDPATGGAMKYDANGNITEMWQTGLQLASSAVIDKLNYTYLNENSSNRLVKVTDGVAGADNGKLGDFKDGANPGDDYAYDANGNLQYDHNKAISSITYNHLNLPAVITVTGKGAITYLYDAAGNKLKKVIVEAPSTTNGNKTITTTTTYCSGLVYESRTISPADPNRPDYTDKLLFAGH